MYTKIVNPYTNRKVSIFSKQGKIILRSYLDKQSSAKRDKKKAFRGGRFLTRFFIKTDNYITDITDDIRLILNTQFEPDDDEPPTLLQIVDIVNHNYLNAHVDSVRIGRVKITYLENKLPRMLQADTGILDNINIDDTIASITFLGPLNDSIFEGLKDPTFQKAAKEIRNQRIQGYDLAKGYMENPFSKTVMERVTNQMDSDIEEKQKKFLEEYEKLSKEQLDTKEKEEEEKLQREIEKRQREFEISKTEREMEEIARRTIRREEKSLADEVSFMDYLTKYMVDEGLVTFQIPIQGPENQEDLIRQATEVARQFLYLLSETVWAGGSSVKNLQQYKDWVNSDGPHNLHNEGILNPEVVKSMRSHILAHLHQ